MPSITWSACPTHLGATVGVHPKGELAQDGGTMDITMQVLTLFSKSGMCFRSTASCSWPMVARRALGRADGAAPAGGCAADGG